MKLLKKFASRKLLVAAGSSIFSGWLISKGIAVTPEDVESAMVAVSENGAKGLIGVVQLWIWKRYIEEQATIDFQGSEAVADVVEDIVKGD